jgi:AcrR family transcriptional regulator
MNARPSGIELNLQGQRLGRKGQETRARIIAVARELIEEGGEEQLSLTAVARRAELRMSSLYNYFTDLADLFLAVAEPTIAASEDAYVGFLRQRWPDDALPAHCLIFVQAFHEFWRANARLLHMRNAIADQHEPRIMTHRIDMARAAIRLLGQQMDAPADRFTGVEYDLASVLYTGLERVVTIATDERLKSHYPPTIQPRFQGETIKQQARLFALAIADERTNGVHT